MSHTHPAQEHSSCFLPAFLFLLFTCFTAHAQTIRYVSPAGAGSGTSWADASGDLQSMITASAVNDQVWVMAGTYTPGAVRTASFSMRNGVAIYGSFAGTETLLSERDLSGGLTSILSAEMGAPGNTDNCYHVISNTGLDSTAIIDGFVISGANDDRAPTLTEGLGGGILNDGSNGSNCSPVIRNCLITGNTAQFGAGIFNSGYNSGTSVPHISACVIAGNTAITGGGGIDNFGLLLGNASPLITNSVIYGNTAAQRAGAMYCWGGNDGNASPVVVNTCFIGNSAIDGGAVVSDRLNSSSGSSGTSDPSFRNCIFWGNTASGTGPQFYLLGGANFYATFSDVDLTAQTAPHVMSGPGTGNISTDPMFLDIATGTGIDGLWFTSDDGLQLQALSPCLDVGDNSSLPPFDILLNPRIINTTVDMGAYEYSPPPMSVPGIAVAGYHDGTPLLLYPNPAGSSLYISGAVEGEIWEMMNAFGQLLSSGITHLGEPVNLAQLPAGIYALRVGSRQVLFTKAD